MEGEQALAEALTSQSGPVRIMARAAASNWVEQMTAWLNDEINRPKANPAEIMFALAVMQMQTYASISSQLVTVEGHKHAVDLYRRVVDDKMLKHMRRTLVAAKAAGQAL
jgi:hypothetical protein